MKNLLFLCLVFIAHPVCAQTAEDSVKAVVNKLFAAMKAADAKALRDCFADSAVLQTIHTNKEETNLETETVSSFADAILKISKGDADEQIVIDIIRTDGELAMAWAPYRFYWKGNLNHYGVGSFQLVRVKGVWKIQYLIDTRREENCK